MSTLVFIVVFLVSAAEVVSLTETKTVLEFITRGGNDGRVPSRWTGQLGLMLPGQLSNSLDCLRAALTFASLHPLFH